MRLDKYLKVSRLIKRRTVANDACDAARITVNGKPAKASYQVKLGDVIEIAFGQRTMRVEVLNIAEHALKADAAAMYEELPYTDASRVGGMHFGCHSGSGPFRG